MPDGGTAPFLVVAPTSVVGNWEAETARFAPGLTVRAIGETFAKNGSDPAEAMAGADIIITSYALFRLDYEAYAARKWAGLVLDEAQFVKNPPAKAYQCARRSRPRSSSPSRARPGEQPDGVLVACRRSPPRVCSRPKRFAEYYQRPIEKER